MDGDLETLQSERLRLRAKFEKHAAQLRDSTDNATQELIRYSDALEETAGHLIQSGYLDSVRAHAADMRDDNEKMVAAYQELADIAEKISAARPRPERVVERVVERTVVKTVEATQPARPRQPAREWSVLFTLVWLCGFIAGACVVFAFAVKH
jgi:hypothetical protein